MPSRLRQTAVILVLTSIFSAGCGRADRPPIDEANHLFLYSKFDEAIQAGNSALELASTAEEKSSAYLLIGKCQFELASKAESEGNAYAAKQRLDDAIAAFTSSIELHDNHLARYHRRDAYRSAGNEELAATDYLRARALDQEYQAARINEKPEEIRDYTKLDIDYLADEETPIEDQDDRSSDDEFVDDPIVAESTPSDVQEQNVMVGAGRRQAQPKNQAAGFADNGETAEPKVGGQLSEWLTQHKRRIAVPDGARDQFQFDRSPLLDDLQDPADETSEDEESQAEPNQVEPGPRWTDPNFPSSLGPNGLGRLPTTGIPTTGYPSASSLPVAGAPSTGIGGSTGGPNASTSRSAGILPTSPTTGVGTARRALPFGLPSDATAPTGLLRGFPEFRHGVSLPRSGTAGSQSLIAPSAGIPADLAPIKPMPSFGPTGNRPIGPVQFQTSPLSQPRAGQPVRNTPRSTVSPQPR